MSLGLGLGLAFAAGQYKPGAGGGPPSPITPGAYEDFTGTAASSLHGKVTVTGGLTWAAILGNAGVTNQVKLTGTGEAYGLGTSGTTATSPTVIDTGNPDLLAVRYRVSPKATSYSKSAAGAVILDPVYTGDGTTNLWSKTGFGPASINAGAVTLKIYSGTGLQGASSATVVEGAANPGCYSQAGDNYEVRQRKVAATILRDGYQNGRLMWTGAVDWVASSVPPTGKVGVSGVLEVTGSRPISDFQAIDLATQGWLSLDRPARIAQLEDDGSVVLNLFGEYNLAAPTGLKVTAYNASTEAALTSMSSVSLSSFVAGAGLWSGVLTIPAASMPASNVAFFLRIERDLGAGNTAYAFSCVQQPGEVAATTGQSLSDNGYLIVQGTPAPYGLVCDGSISSAANAIDRRTMPQGTGSNPHNWASNIAAIMGTASGFATGNLCLIRSCRGGTFLQDPTTFANGREIGTANWTAELDGIKRAGNRHAVEIYTGGQFEAIGSNHKDMTTITNQQAYVNALIAQIDAKDAILGRALKVILSYGGFNTSGADANCDAMRRLNAWLIFTYPTRFFQGPHYADLTHGTDGALGSDTYHPSTVGFQKYGNRIGYSWAKVRGKASVDRAGPFPVSLTRLSATQLKLRVNKNGATTADVINTAVNGDFSGGGLFSSNDSTFGAGNLKVPTAYSVADIDATFADVTWTFPAASFPGTAYFKIHTGENPVNRTNNATIAAAIETQASMLVGVYADDNVFCQPFYDFTNPALQSAYTTDWLSAS